MPIENQKLLVSISIHVLIPLIGMVVYLILLKHMKKAQLVNPPYGALFLIMLCYGVLFIVFSTFVLNVYSPLLLIGLLFIFFVSPLIMISVSIYAFSRRNLSSYHKGCFIGSVLYFPIICICIFVCFYYSR